jgi:hypothetical protein
VNQVECHSGYEYAERPLALNWQGQRLEVREILSRWRSPGIKGFRVRTDDDRIFELLYVEAEDQWQIHSL